MKILCIDDTGLFLHLLNKQLQILGFHDVIQCNNIHRGMELLVNDAKIGLVFSDLWMSAGSGIDFLTQIRHHPVERIRKVPFIMVTSENKSSLVMEAAKLGLNGYLCKPIPIEVLKAKMDSLFPPSD